MPRTRPSGLSLLEILVTIALLSTVMVAFAAVYPASLKLNRKSQRGVQAAELAGAIAEEIRALPFSAPGLCVTRMGAWHPSDPFYAGFPRTRLPEPYTLMSPGGEPGIEVTTSSAGPLSFANVRVTLFWKESANERMLDRQVSVCTSRASNR